MGSRAFSYGSPRAIQQQMRLSPAGETFRPSVLAPVDAMPSRSAHRARRTILSLEPLVRAVVPIGHST